MLVKLSQSMPCQYIMYPIPVHSKSSKCKFFNLSFGFIVMLLCRQSILYFNVTAYYLV